MGSCLAEISVNSLGGRWFLIEIVGRSQVVLPEGNLSRGYPVVGIFSIDRKNRLGGCDRDTTALLESYNFQKICTSMRFPDGTRRECNKILQL
ncbi:hypothetical protein V6N13_015065 [Hibiscus sabdariffa]